MIQKFQISEPEYQKERDELLEALDKGLISSKMHPSIYYELNRIETESIITSSPTVLCDMPEILMRMKIASIYSLTEMQEIFNQVMKLIDKREGPIIPGAAALYLYPDVFQKHRDDYIYSMIRKIAEEGHILA